MRLPRVVWWACTVVLVACVDPAPTSPEDAGSSDGAVVTDAGRDAAPAPGTPLAGLSLLAQEEQPTPGPHLVEVVPHGDAVYVANSWDSFTVYGLLPDGGLEMTLERPIQEGAHRCTTLAVHAPSRTLYCSSDESHVVRTYDLTDPLVPVLRDGAALELDRLWVRDLHVAGDRLYFARFDLGLWVADLAPDGSISNLRRVPLDANVRFVDGGGDRLAVLTSDRGLILLRENTKYATPWAEVPLEGPPLDLAVRGDRALVALGSAGVAVVDLSADPPSVQRRITPPAVATGADLDGASLAVATLTGAYLYDLSVDPPRLAGFAPAGREEERTGGVMLDVRFVGGELLISDWIFVERYAVDPGGHALALDLPRGFWRAPGADVVVPVRNAGDLSLSVQLTASDVVVEATLAPGEEARLTLPADAVATPLLEESRRVLVTSVVEGVGPVWRSALFVAERSEAEDPLQGHPAPGDLFSDVRFASPDLRVIALPLAGVRHRVVFFGVDCAAMWPEMQDMAWLLRSGRGLDGGATPVLIGLTNFGGDGYTVKWGLEGVTAGHTGYLAPEEVVLHNGSETVYEDRFMLPFLPRAAYHPTDYLVDETGVVEAVETFYRGAHALR